MRQILHQPSVNDESGKKKTNEEPEDLLKKTKRTTQNVQTWRTQATERLLLPTTAPNLRRV